LRCIFSLDESGRDKDGGVVGLGRLKVVLRWKRQAELIKE
jgi:hypothetical protein